MSIRKSAFENKIFLKHEFFKKLEFNMCKLSFITIKRTDSTIKFLIIWFYGP